MTHKEKMTHKMTLLSPEIHLTWLE
jgi:hypothetical protein